MLDIILTTVTSVLGSVTLGSSIVGITAFVKTLKDRKKLNALAKSVTNDVQITKEGIIEGFKAANLDTTWKVDLSTKIDTKLDEWFVKIKNNIVAHEEYRTKLAIYNSKILSNTAAYNKLTDSEKTELKELLKNNEKDITIE